MILFPANSLPSARQGKIFPCQERPSLAMPMIMIAFRRGGGFFPCCSRTAGKNGAKNHWAADASKRLVMAEHNAMAAGRGLWRE
jgi:hypothetical protein